MRISLFGRLFSPRTSWLCAVLLLSPALTEAQSFTLTIEDVVIPYDPATGMGTATVSVLLEQDLAPGENADPVPGFSFSYSHDQSLINTIGVSSAPALQALNGGMGPDLGAQSPFPDGGVVSAIFNIFGGVTLTFEDPTPVIELTFATNPATWIGNTTGGSTGFTDANPPGQSPPIDDVVVVDNNGAPITWAFPVIQLVPIVSFLRGDADGDGQVIPVGDAITILGGLFAGETIPCLVAADVNGDSTVDLADPISLLNFGFLGGSPPPPPFPSCGPETNPATSLGCEESSC